MSDTLLSTTLHAVATAIGDRLPAAYGLDPSEVLVASDAAVHDMPAGATAVRWTLGDEEAVLVVAVTSDAAAMLQAGPPEASLVEALSPRVTPVLPLLAKLLGSTPELGEGEEVPADEALTVGPGDAVSVRLDDTGVHRATIALRMVIPDALVQIGAPQTWDEMDDYSDPVGVPLEAPIGMNGVPVGLDAADSGGAYGPVGQPGHDEAGYGSQSYASGHGQAPAGRRKAYAPPGVGPQSEAHPAEFAAFDQLHSFPGATHSMAMLGEVEMGVTAELGRTKLTVRDVLGLNQGSIIELDRAAGSPVDVVVNGTLIARGEVVVIDEEFGIRITEIIGMDEDAHPAAPVNLPLAQ